MEKLLKALELVKQQAALADINNCSLFGSIISLLEDGIEEVAILFVNPATQEVHEDGMKIIHEMSLESLEKFRDFVGNKIEPESPYDLLKQGLTLRSTPKGDSPYFAALREQYPSLLNHPLAPQNEQELAFDKVLHDMFVKSPMNLAHNANVEILHEEIMKPPKELFFFGKDSQPTFTLLDIPGYTPIAAHLVILDDLLYDMEYPEMPARVIMVSRNIEEKFVTIQVERGIQYEAALVYIPELTTLLVKEKHAQLPEPQEEEQSSNSNG